MPIYEFLCKSCGLRFELIRAVGEVEVVCPDCGGRAKKAIVSRVSVRSGSTAGKGKPDRECDRSSPCCGRDEPCDDRSCH